MSADDLFTVVNRRRHNRPTNRNTSNDSTNNMINIHSNRNKHGNVRRPNDCNYNPERRRRPTRSNNHYQNNSAFDNYKNTRRQNIHHDNNNNGNCNVNTSGAFNCHDTKFKRNNNNRKFYHQRRIKNNQSAIERRLDPSNFPSLKRQDDNGYSEDAILSIDEKPVVDFKKCRRFIGDVDYPVFNINEDDISHEYSGITSFKVLRLLK